MELQLGPQVISSYKRLAYEVWYAFAEFVDNSTQSYFNNRKALDKVFKKERAKLFVSITTEADARGPFIRIVDNSIGMSEAELQNAVCIGKPPLNTSGRSRYGLGLKTGASWFGDIWTIETKKLNETESHKITVDVEKVAKGNLNLPHEKTPAPKGEHRTIIEIRKLHRKITPKVLKKVKDYLSSLYRVDLSKRILCLSVNGDEIEWDTKVDERLARFDNGKLAKKKFSFKIGKKKVSGWAGVLEKGSRRDAGLSIIQSDRVIMGWPEAYKPETIYGEQEGGVNDLVNQRLFGELVLEGFDVSHTKDQILFQDGEGEKLEAELGKRLEHLRHFALTRRKPESKEGAKRTFRTMALKRVEEEVKSKKLQDFFKGFEIPPDELTKKSNSIVRDAVLSRSKPSLQTKLNDTSIVIYLAEGMSPNDPYVIIDSTKTKNKAVVVINIQHPYWSQLNSSESVLNFVRHCVYDGVAESKAYARTSKIEPDTVKLIKDNLLRVPFL